MVRGGRLFVGRPEGKRSLGRPSVWWVDNITINLGMGWIDLAQYRDQWRPLVNMEMNLQVL
jgi:hypothetical protein